MFSDGCFSSPQFSLAATQSAGCTRLYRNKCQLSSYQMGIGGKMSCYVHANEKTDIHVCSSEWMKTHKIFKCTKQGDLLICKSCNLQMFYQEDHLAQNCSCVKTTNSLTWFLAIIWYVWSKRKLKIRPHL